MGYFYNEIDETDNIEYLYYYDDTPKKGKGKKTDDAPEETAATRMKISVSLAVPALAIDDNNEWGKLLEWQDFDKKPVRWVMPHRFLASKDDVLVGELLKRGAYVAPSPNARYMLKCYLSNEKPTRRVRLVSKLGWHDGNVYVFPDATYGTGDIEFIPPDVKDNPYRVSGTTEEWINNIGRYCVGNSRLMLAVSTVFGSALLHFTGDQNTLLHSCGQSSTGKTTAQQIGTSIAGPPKATMFSWNNTQNGFEGNCTERNDGAINLDEIGQVDPRILGEVVYMIANGAGKGAMTRERTLRQTNKWRMLALSSGEVGLIEKLTMADKHVFAGQEIRVLEIPADAGLRMGVIEDLHGFATSAQLIKTLQENIGLYHGAVFREFIASVAITDPIALTAMLRQKRDAFATQYVPPGASAQVTRAANIFGLICAAGEVASALNLTGWPVDQVKANIAKCFNAWLVKRETIDDLETTRGIEQVLRIIQTQGHRFEEIDYEFPVPNRLGFKQIVVNPQDPSGKGVWEYHIYPEMWKRELCKGYNPQLIAIEMSERGWMRRDGKHLAPVKRLGKHGRERMFHVTSAAFLVPDDRTPEQKQDDHITNIFKNMGYDDTTE